MHIVRNKHSFYRFFCPIKNGSISADLLAFCLWVFGACVHFCPLKKFTLSISQERLRHSLQPRNSNNFICLNMLLPFTLPKQNLLYRKLLFFVVMAQMLKKHFRKIWRYKQSAAAHLTFHVTANICVSDTRILVRGDHARDSVCIFVSLLADCV